MAGNRLFFPVQAVIFYSGAEWAALEESAGVGSNKDYNPATNSGIVPATPQVAHGVQDVSMTSNFSLTPVFETGQSGIYENTEGIPTVEITLSKVLDGKPLLWHLATLDALKPDLAGRTAVNSTFQLGLWPDTENRCFWKGNSSVDANGNVTEANDEVVPIGVITCPKCYPSSLSYTVNTTEASTESLTLSGNEKVWARALQSQKTLPNGDPAFTIQNDVRFNTAYADFKDNNDRPEQRIAQGYNVMLKPLINVSSLAGASQEDIIASPLTDSNGALKDPDCSVFPIEIPGITLWGTNDVEGQLNATEDTYQPDPNFARIQSVSFNVTLTRNDVMALGYKMPVHKTVQMPIQVTTEITVTSTTDDGIQVSAFTSACQNTAALRPGTIRLAICNGDADNGDRADANGVRIYTGDQNKLTSVSFGQGGTGGGNVQATYSYQTNNAFTVVAKTDPNVRNWDPAANNGAGGLLAGGWWDNRAAWVC